MIFTRLLLYSFTSMVSIFSLLQKSGLVICLLVIALLPVEVNAENVILGNTQQDSQQGTKKSTALELKNLHLVHTLDVLTDAEKEEEQSYGERLGMVFIFSKPYPLALSPDGRKMASGGINTIRLWDLQTGNEIGEPLFSAQGLRPLGISLILFSPDAKFVTVFSSGRELSSSNRKEFSFWEPIEEVWDLSTQTKVSSGLPSNQTKERLSFSSTLDKSLSGRLSIEIQQMIESQHDGKIYSLVLSADEKTLVTSGKDAKIRIWRND